MYPESLNHQPGNVTPLNEELRRSVLHGATEELSAAMEMVEHCLRQLSDEQIWHRDEPSLHSIGNVLLHLEGNLRQWVVAGLGSACDARRRPREFSELGPIAKRQLLDDLRVCVAEARQAIAELTIADLLRVRRIQGFEMTGIAALWHALPHFRGHVQELIRLTRSTLGDRYQFAWTPMTPEQGGPP